MANERRTVPTSPLKLPYTLLVDGFTLTVQEFTRPGFWDSTRRLATDVSGIAWLSLCGGSPPILPVMEPIPAGYVALANRLHVVAQVTDPQTQISLEAARRIKPDIELGTSLDLDVVLPHDAVREIVAGHTGIADWIFGSRAGQILVQFDEVTIKPEAGRRGVGRIVAGEATYPTADPIPRVIRHEVEGFTLVIDRFSLSPRGLLADLDVELPAGIGAATDCGPARLALKNVHLTADCELYAERPAAAFGPWIVSDAGLVVEGTGYLLDLSLSVSPTGRLPAWRGLLLAEGQASGAALVPLPSNTGYLGAKYAFRDASIAATGFTAHLDVATPHTFDAVNPLNYMVSFGAGYLDVASNRVSGGALGPGEVTLPPEAVCGGAVGNKLVARFTELTVQADLDLAGEVVLNDEMGWGELTHPGEEIVPWLVAARTGYLYLPAGPRGSFSPDTGAAFLHLALSGSTAAKLLALETAGMAGMTCDWFDNLRIFSPDRPGGTALPLVLARPWGWLHVGSRGTDGELWAAKTLHAEPLGEPARPGYVGNKPFEANLFVDDKLARLLQFATSAVYESNLDGSVRIPEPCDIPALDFTHMTATSTAHLVGGDVILPVGGVQLTHWELQLAPTGDPAQAGVLSVRTGRIVFTAAGISEPRHFAQPFGLTWAEMLADGNLGELFFDYNCWGQRFDGLSYSPHSISLSKYVAGATDAYLATCGTVHLNYFGPCFANIRDACYPDASPPFNKRYVTVPKAGEGDCKPTDLRLHAIWNNSAGGDLAVFDFPDVSMDYHEAAQDGFLGAGTTAAGFLHSDGLNATIEIHATAIDISLSSLVTHDLDIGLFTRLGALGGIWGCIRIDGPVITRMSITGYLEVSATSGSGILEPRGAVAAEVNITTTATSFDFYVSGEMFLTVAGCGLDVSASVHLFYDFLRGSAEGDLQGRINCSAIVAGLEGDGQVSWYVDSVTQYLQGRMKIGVCGWTGGLGLEGGLFVGHNVPKAKAWVLHSGGERFGVSDAQLSDYLTGVYGFGRISFGVNWYIFGGGVDIYAGVGAFNEIPPGATSAIPGLALPYVLGKVGLHVYGEILGGLVSASAWATLTLRGPVPLYFEGSFGLEGCVLWVICASISVTAGISSDGFYIY